MLLTSELVELQQLKPSSLDWVRVSLLQSPQTTLKDVIWLIGFLPCNCKETQQAWLFGKLTIMKHSKNIYIAVNDMQLC